MAGGADGRASFCVNTSRLTFESRTPTRLGRLKTFVSLGAMLERARREVVRRDEGPGTYAITDPMESYMWHQGTKFVERFDANSYLRIMEAWQHFDLASDAGVDDLADAFIPCKHQRYMIFTIDSDVCFYPEEQTDLARYLKLADVPHREDIAMTGQTEILLHHQPSRLVRLHAERLRQRHRLDVFDLEEEEDVVRLVDFSPDVDNAHARVALSGFVGVKDHFPSLKIRHPIAAQHVFHFINPQSIAPQNLQWTAS